MFTSTFSVYIFIRLYDKRDDFNFVIITFPHLDSNICLLLPRMEFIFHNVYVMLEVAAYIQNVHYATVF